MRNIWAYYFSFHFDPINNFKPKFEASVSIQFYRERTPVLLLNSQQKIDNVFFRNIVNLQIKDHFQYLQNKHPKSFQMPCLQNIFFFSVLELDILKEVFSENVDFQLIVNYTLIMFKRHKSIKVVILKTQELVFF